MTLKPNSHEPDPDHDQSAHMTPEAFRSALHEIGYGVHSFAVFTGANHRTVRRWLSGELNVPRWVPIMLALMNATMTLDDASGAQSSAEMLTPGIGQHEITRRVKVAAGCFIHHIDGNPANNAIENLSVVDRDGNPVSGHVKPPAGASHDCYQEDDTDYIATPRGRAR